MAQEPSLAPPHPPIVAPLSHFLRKDVAIAGGKAANLGELMRAGFEVPGGFVVTTAAYELFLRSAGMDRTIEDVLRRNPVRELEAASRASLEIMREMQRAPVPGAIAEAAIGEYRAMGDGAVAVRSSATAEDLPEASFAGQQATFLNVTGEAELIDSVRKCWASLWSERAMTYRARQAIDSMNVKLAVVVQRMIPADVAGVLFTANPLTGSRSEVVIDANPGLGEAVVSGTAIPDHFVLGKRFRNLKERSMGQREPASTSSGGADQTSPAADGEKKPSLPLAALRELVRLGIAIERHFGSPQDVEWAWIDNGTKPGEVFVLQARPMTALPTPVSINPVMRRILPILAEMWPTRPYPLDVTTFTGALERAVGSLLKVLLGRSAPDPDELLIEEEGVVVRLQPPALKPSADILVAPWLALWRTRRYDPTRWQSDPILPQAIARAGELELVDLPGQAWEGLLEILREALDLMPRLMLLRERYLPPSLLGLGGLWLMLVLTGRRHRFGKLTAGVGTKTDETNRALEELATRIRLDPTLRDLFERHTAGELRSALKAHPQGGSFLEVFKTFLQRYGHRETSLTISQGSWKDRPEFVLDLLKGLARSEPEVSRGSETWHAARDELLGTTILGTRPLRGVFLTALAKARAFFQIREDTHFYATLVLPIIRNVALELGRRLELVGVLDSVEDVFHLRLEELHPLGEPWPPPPPTIVRLRRVISRRRAKREAMAARPIIDPRWLASGTRRGAEEGILLTGSSASPGVARGPVRVVRDGSEFSRLQAGDVLVAPVTNPAWTPLFRLASAVVVDTGGSASHAAIVAREYGIPAVMGTLVGTRELSDGQWVEVDGSRGLVRRAEPTHGVSETR